MKKRTWLGKNYAKLCAFLALTVICFLFITPLLYGIFGSFRSYDDFTANKGSLFPTSWDAFTLDGYKELFTKTEFVKENANEWFPIWNWLLNSAIVAIGGTLIYLLIATLAAYAFTFIDFKYNKAIFAFLIGTMVIPGVVSTTPQLINMNMLGAWGNLAGLIIPSFGGVYGVYLIRQFFSNIPKDLIENARMDGASNVKIFRRVVLPLGKSVIYVQGLFGFMGAWNDVQWAQLIIGSAPRSTWTLAYGLKVISDNCESAESITLAFASAVISMIPILIVYLLAQSKIIEGVANTGVKR